MARISMISNFALRHARHASPLNDKLSLRMISTTGWPKDLEALGLPRPQVIHQNLDYETLFKHEVAKKEGTVAKTKYGGTFNVGTGKYKGRTPKDKWFVKREGAASAGLIDWGPINQPISPEAFNELLLKSVEYMATLPETYVFDGYVGASPASRRHVRFVHEKAWQQHFVTNMFIRPEGAEVEALRLADPDFTVINSCALVDEDWKRHGVNSETVVAFDIERKLCVVYGTWYGGENKKGAFSLMNYWLPIEGTLCMHCSASVDQQGGDTALFFGLSGTGKTTLSSDPNRLLIGDDEHGWDDNGVFNLEGGCYAKTSGLKEEFEPAIYGAIRGPGALLENVAGKPDTLVEDGEVPNFDDTSLTENGRVSYPIEHIEARWQPQMAGHPSRIIFLTCDAFGVLPPVAALDAKQAMYHFLSGYTSKVAGTEMGVTEPSPTFSACFGAAFLPLHPTAYADLLEKKLAQHDAKAYLVNSGWSGGRGAADGASRLPIKVTRACVKAILSGAIDAAAMRVDPTFGFCVPEAIQDVAPEYLVPADADKTKGLAARFIKNFGKFGAQGEALAKAGGPAVIPA